MLNSHSHININPTGIFNIYIIDVFWVNRNLILPLGLEPRTFSNLENSFRHIGYKPTVLPIKLQELIYNIHYIIINIFCQVLF